MFLRATFVLGLCLVACSAMTHAPADPGVAPRPLTTSLAEPTENASHALSSIQHAEYILNDPTGVAQSYVNYALLNNGDWPCGIQPTVNQSGVYGSAYALLTRVPNLTSDDEAWVLEQLPQPSSCPSHVRQVH